MIGVGIGLWWVDKAPNVLVAAIRGKLAASNRINLGSTTVAGTVLPTSTVSRTFLSVINTYLRQGLTIEEADFILANSGRYVMTIGVGDRRSDAAALTARFALATNWSGSEVSNLLLIPEPFPTVPYGHRLTMSNGALTVTDAHSGSNIYGSIRYFTLEER